MWKRLPTRERGIIATDEDDVAFVPSSRERNRDSLSYILPCGFCGLAYDWLGMVTVLPGELCCSFDTFGFPFKCKKRSGLRMVWQGCVWMLWKARNACIFEGKVMTICEIVEAIKHMSIYNGFLLVVLVFVAHHMSGLNYHFFVC
jgi:hypothetical protein